MNYFKYITPLLIVVLASCIYNTKTETTIIGKTTSDDIPEQIYYSVPINGICNGLIKDSVLIDSKGNFEIKLDIEKPSFVKLMIWGKASRTLVIEKGRTYQLELSTETSDYAFHVIDENKEVQDKIRSLKYSSHIQNPTRQYLKLSSIEETRLKLKTAKEEELNTFKELLSEDKISNGFYQLIQIDRDCFYAAIKATISLIKKYEDLRKENGAFTKEYKNLWQESFTEASVSNINLMRSPWYFSFADNFVEYNIFNAVSFKQEDHVKLYEDGLYHSNHLEISKKHLQSIFAEYHHAAYLMNAAIQKRFEKELISLYHDFTSDYPNSQYTIFLSPMIDPIEEFHIIKEKPFNSNIEFVERSEQQFVNDKKDNNTLKDVIQSLHGKKLYVDVWATWCGPCKEEFKHKSKLYDLLNEYNVEVLYISIDEKDKDQQWRDMIKFYELKGHHIRANEQLDEELRKLYPLHEGIAIPWYMLVDENGKVKIDFASKPSELKSLEMELKLI